MTALVVTFLSLPPIIGVSGLNGESVPNATMNPVFFFELVQTTVVPAFTQNNWLFRTLGMLGLTLEELTDRVMSTVQGDDAEPHVLAALHMLSGCDSSQAYLLFVCALAQAELRTAHKSKNDVVVPVRLRIVNWTRIGCFSF